MNVCIAAGNAAKEQSLAGGNAPLASVVEAPAGVARHLERGMFVLWRCVGSGSSSDRLLGQPLWAVVHPEDHLALIQAMTAVILAPVRTTVSAPLSFRLAFTAEGKYVSVEAR